jgi:hypothetical protein
MKPVYAKVETTAADIILILIALYTRAEDIPASPDTRVSFHNAVIQMGTGAFRPGVLEDTLCEQYTVSVVHDSCDDSWGLPSTVHKPPQSFKLLT